MLRCYSNSATKPCKGAAMPIIPRLDRVMADRKMSVNELSQRIDISPVNISRMRRGHIKAVRFSTMERICEVLQCQPGDLFEYVSPEPGTDEAVELDAIINRPIEEPARKAHRRRLPHPCERGQLVFATTRTSQDASPGVLFHARETPPKSAPRELHPRETHFQETRLCSDAPFCSIEEVP